MDREDQIVHATGPIESMRRANREYATGPSPRIMQRGQPRIGSGQEQTEDEEPPPPEKHKTTPYHKRSPADAGTSAQPSACGQQLQRTLWRPRRSHARAGT
jgi:hypothetical protein